MITYKPEGSLHFLSIHAIHLAHRSYYAALDHERTYHCIQGEFMYRGLLTDGQVFVREEDMDMLLPMLELTVFKVEGNTLYVRSGDACLAVPLHVRHISTEHLEEEDEEEEEMIFLPIRKRGSILHGTQAGDRTLQVLQHLRGRTDLGFA